MQRKIEGTHCSPEPVLSRGLSLPRWANPGSPTSLELSPDPKSALPWWGDTRSPIFLGAEPQISPSQQGHFHFYVLMILDILNNKMSTQGL